MTNRQDESGSVTSYTADDFRQKGRKRLNIRHIRELVEKVAALPNGAALPDLSDVTVGDRFAIGLRLIPRDLREHLLGKSDEQLRRYEAGADIPLPVIAALSAEAELPLDWFVTGRAMERRPPLIYVSSNQRPADDVPLQKMSFRVAAGTGLELYDEPGNLVHFPRAILDHVGVKSHNARLMEASGDSMRPTIADGDLLLVDVSSTQIIEGKIYVFSIGSEAYVKRLRRLGEDILMLSDNRELFPEPEKVPAGLPFRVFGLVKWAGHTL
jgi:phage repressor protein C with HTH and peptisase S24 domain